MNEKHRPATRPTSTVEDIREFLEQVSVYSETPREAGSQCALDSLQCYLHTREIDANETPYDPAQHYICRMCGAKLRVMAGLIPPFESGSEIVSVTKAPLKAAGA